MAKVVAFGFSIQFSSKVLSLVLYLRDDVTGPTDCDQRELLPLVSRLRTVCSWAVGASRSRVQVQTG